MRAWNLNLIGKVAVAAMSEGQSEIVERRNDLEYQLALAEECIAESSIWPYVFERTVVLLAKVRRYEDALRVCLYIKSYSERAEADSDGKSAKIWKSPGLEKCIERIPKLERAIAKARGDAAAPDFQNPYYWWERVGSLPLAKQCEEMGITFQDIGGLNFEGSPEKAALEHFSEQGWHGSYCEGGAILILIRAAALDALDELNTFKSREDACRRFTEAQLEIQRDNIERICDAVRAVEPERVRKNFREIHLIHSNREHNPGLNEDFIGNLFSAIGADDLANITKAIGDDPYKYRNGWPDLTLVDSLGRMRWVEVKTTDKLHRSQIETLIHMMPRMPGSVEVVRLI